MRSLSLLLPLAVAAIPAHGQTLVSQTNGTGFLGSIPGPSMAAAAQPGGYVIQRGPATPENVAVAMLVHDPRGYRIGQVSAVERDGVVVRYAGGLTKVPYPALRSEGRGLRVGLVSYKFNEVARRNPY